jgi:hypothetical protein
VVADYKFKSSFPELSSVIETDSRIAQVTDGAPAIRLIRVRSAIRNRPGAGCPEGRAGTACRPDWSRCKTEIPAKSALSKANVTAGGASLAKSCCADCGNK